MCRRRCRRTRPLALQRLLPLLEQANQALGRLDGLASILPDPSLFIYLYVRKEAVLSSQIEGTQSSFSDLMLFESAEAPSVPLEDVQEVSNYVAAMNHGLRRLREDFPLSLRLIREIHNLLDRFCAFTYTFNESRSSQSPQQPDNSLSLRPLWRRLCSTWWGSAWYAKPPASSAIASSRITATWKFSTGAPSSQNEPFALASHDRIEAWVM
jgi:hypothetical protein